MRTLQWAIEEIESAHPDLYLEHCSIMAVALMRRWSEVPCQFLVECEGFHLPEQHQDNESFLLRITWREATALAAERVWRTEQPNPIIERAAVALAALLFAHLIPNGSMRVARVGDRADYWLPHLRRALEISGTERRQDFARRCQEKKAQLLANAWGADGYVVVCCFHPTHPVIRCSYYTQEKQET